MELAKIFSVCIVGRPNVGKSTLFNRIIGRRKAVVHETDGTTRDRIEAIYEEESVRFRLIDTGGFVKSAPDKISSLVKRQIEEAVSEADLLLFLCDAKTGVAAQDEEMVPILRRCSKKVFLVVNKADNKELEKDSIYDFYRLGLGEPYAVSALHNRGIGKLIDDISKTLSVEEKGKDEEIICNIAIVGRPNVGKSLFLNTLLKKERVIVDEKPGTTRDSIDTYLKKDDDLYLLIDTAGIRHKRKVKEPVDFYGMSRSMEAIRRSGLSFLLIDGYDGLRNDDIRIFNFIMECGKCCALVVNKWDLVKNIQMAAYKDAIISRCPTTAHYPIVFASAKTGRNVLSCLDMVKHIVANASQTIETKELNAFLSSVKRLSYKRGGKTPRLYYMVQTSARPPAFLIFVNNPRLITKDYTKFIEGMLRKGYNFFGTPIRINYRGRV